MPLTDLLIRHAKSTTATIKLTDSHGLYLEVTPTGSRLWRYRYRLGGKESTFAIGVYPQVSLSMARECRDAAKAMVKAGRNPALERKAARQEQQVANDNTFRAVAREWLERKTPKWTPYYANQVAHILDADVYPAIGALPIDAIKVPHVRALLRPIEKRGAKTVAILARQHVYAVFNDAIAHGLTEYNPAASLRRTIERDKVKHATVLEKVELAALLKRVENYRSAVMRIALQMLAHTFVRTAELRLATWEEIDFVGCEWRIPAEHMKKRVPHTVPLTRQTIAFLTQLKALTGHGKHLFPNLRRPDAPMTNTSVNRALGYCGFAGKFSAHGFRATASTHLNEGTFTDANGRPLVFRPDVIELQLAHVETNRTRRAYNRAEYLAERRVMMKVWSDFLDSLTSDNVIPITGRDTGTRAA